MTRRARLKWHCRRGMRELDLLLDEFLEMEYEGLSTADRDRFERLLECRNEDLMDWLMEGASPPDEELAGIASRIREWRAPSA
jgi:antitoxin CptB